MAPRDAFENPTPHASARRRPLLAAALVAVAFLAIALLALPDYGPTWDCSVGDYAYGEAVLDGVTRGVDVVALYQLGEPSLARAPHPAFERTCGWAQMFPLAATLSAASCRLLWTELGWLPPLAAHHLVVPLLVAILLAALVVFLGPLGTATGVAAAAFLVGSPRFQADAMNNLKDAPQAVLYSLSALAFFAVHRAPTLRGWCAVGALGALALAQKQNALFLPVQLALTLLVWRLLDREGERRVPSGRTHWIGPVAGAVCAAVTYLAVSPQLWTDFAARLRLHFELTTRAGHAALAGAADSAWTISLEGAQQVLLSTPLPLLVLGAVGACARGASRRLRLFLVVWLLVAVGRTSLPGMRNFDGVRHFLEFYPALAMLAALGLRAVLARTRGLERRFGVVARAALIALAFAPAAIATWRTHPNGVCYFNEIAGGLAGARRAGVPDAVDYWGNSYWQGLAWLAAHAEQGATVLVPVAPHIVRVAAPVRLRGDLELHAAEQPVRVALYAMYLVRPNWYGPTVRTIERLEIAPVHEVIVQGAPVLRIFRLDPAAAGPVLADHAREQRAEGAGARLSQWVMTDQATNLPRLARITAELDEVGLEESVARLRALLPPELHQDAADWLWARHVPR